ncbi:response regulator [Verticiella sediminum]|uniref:histidine kinase n=1 Tax=Verticiella sediminum TaxID=1247510 RepID=A0A556AY82_9BURK|nr:hybrid sensor histidine kinase/response regulator [Verticiella sediminum]TSH97887.1 response regulator [Verticiella sediminum]
MAEPVKILVADDIDQNLVVLQALLERPGLQLLKAQSGAQALELLLEHSVALALLDVHMPGMDGFELAELMRGSPRTRHVPIIFLTATDRNAVRTFRGYEAGAVDFLYKPYDPHILRSKVEIFVQLYEGQRQLAEQNEALQQSLRMNDLFVAILGHDLRNPLSAIMNLAEVVTRGAQDERLRSVGRRIGLSGQRMARLIEQTLDLAMMRAGKVSLRAGPVDLGEICSGIIEEFRGASPEAVLELQTTGATTGAWDGDRLAQVVSNLVGNAVQHGAQDAVRVLVDGSEPERVRLTVSNAGALDEKTLERLLQPFERGTQPGSTQGYGLGLFIVHEIVRLHGGSVHMHSRDGLTVFEITLPRGVSVN